jgi:hypothetical protein
MHVRLNRNHTQLWLLIALVIATGFLLGPRSIIPLGCLIFALFVIGYMVYLQVAWPRGASGRIAVEGSFLVKRNMWGRQVGAVDLRAPYEVSYEYHDDERALYKVVQGGHAMRFSLEHHHRESPVWEALHLQWPPQRPIFW